MIYDTLSKGPIDELIKSGRGVKDADYILYVTAEQSKWCEVNCEYCDRGDIDIAQFF